MSEQQSALRLGFEATSLLGPRTGVGVMTRGLMERLALEPDVELSGVLVSWRGRRHFASVLPDGVAARSVGFPARLAHVLWRHTDRPRLDGFDVMHGPNFVVPPAPGAAEIVTIHDFGPWRFPDLVTEHARAYPRLLERALDRGAHIHVVSGFVADEAVERLGVERDRVHVVHNGFDRGEPGDPVRGLGMAGGRYVLSIGTIEPRKDLPTLVEAMARVAEEVGDLRLVVAGADGWGSDEFEQAVARHVGVVEVVRVGYVTDDERADLLAGATCLAYPSLYEGFGLPPLEAMAQSTPVVTTTAGALPEICGDAARLVPPSDPGALAHAIVQVVSDEEAAARLVAAGHQRTKFFSWDRAAAEMLDLYRRLADGSSAQRPTGSTG